MKIWGMDRLRKNRNKGNTNRRLRIEQLEDKRLLTIVWANEFGTNDFDTEYGADEVIARTIVNRAIDDWNSVLTSFNYAEDNDANPSNNLNDEFQLNVLAIDLVDPGVRGGVLFADTTFNVDSSPTAGTVRLDDNGGGAGWFFDTTPLDDIEFTSVADTFSASFVDVNAVAQARRDDLYRTVVHEIGHAIGITGNPNAAIAGMLTDLVDANNDPVYYLGLSNQNQLSRFESTRANPQFGITATFNGGHIYEGSDVYLLEGVPGVLPDPVTVFEEGNLTTPIAFETAPNDLLNSGITVPGGAFNPENETVRQFISDLDVMILADAYGYTVTLPSDLFSPDAPAGQPQSLPDDIFSTGTAQIILDSLTDTLLIQGLANDPGNTNLRVNDTINVTQVGNDLLGNDLRVAINYTLNDGEQREVIRDIEASRVGQILIAGNGGNDNITFDPAIANLVQLIDYVVSSNVDALEAAGQSNTDGIVDVSDIIPGNQTTLRAAIIEANAGNGEQSIYVGRGIYNLTLTGGGNSAGDLDITGNVTLVGAGAGLTVIDAGGAAGINDRLFEIHPNGSLDLSRMTLTGGNLSAGNASGAAVYVRDDSALTLTDSAVIDNTTIGAGGAIFRLLDGSLTIKRSVFTNNQAGTYGGAIRSNGTMGVLTIEGSIFANNIAGIAGANVLLGNSTIMRNYGNNLIDDTAGDGGFFSSALNDQIAMAGSVDQVVTNMADRIDVTDGGLSLREAIIAANGGAGMQMVWVPAWKHRLELTGGGNNAGDLDIMGDVTIIGVGAGLTVIDAGGENGLGDRVFDVTGTSSLELSRATITGGFLAVGSGAGFRVQGTADLTVTDSAIVGNNAAAGTGGGVFRFMDGDATFLRTTFTGNNAGIRGGAIRTNGQTGTITIEASVFANNTATQNGANVFLSGNKINLGNNFVDNTVNDFGFFSTTQGDYIGSVDYVVTSVADTFDRANDNYSLSVREAIDLANINDNVAEEIWLPAWDFVLTRDRETYGTGTTDIDTSFGDLDISDTLTIRRAGIPLPAGTSAVQWRAGVTDAVFDLLGDFTGDGITSPDDGDVDGADFLAWMLGSSSADGDDDGDVDGDDLAIWSANYGNTLSLFNIV